MWYPPTAMNSNITPSGGVVRSPLSSLQQRTLRIEARPQHALRDIGNAIAVEPSALRLLSSGELDLSFGEGGYSELAPCGSSFQKATVLRIDAEGDILVGGVVTTDGTRDVVVARVCQ